MQQHESETSSDEQISFQKLVSSRKFLRATENDPVFETLNGIDGNFREAEIRGSEELQRAVRARKANWQTHSETDDKRRVVIEITDGARLVGYAWVSTQGFALQIDHFVITAFARSRSSPTRLPAQNMTAQDSTSALTSSGLETSCWCGDSIDWGAR